jgi:hypothetical protein
MRKVTASISGTRVKAWRNSRGVTGCAIDLRSVSGLVARTLAVPLPYQAIRRTTRARLSATTLEDRYEGRGTVSDLTYPACIRDLYESEILGEAVFLALVEIAKNPRERYHLGTLLQLETETKARLRPFLFGYGVSLNEKMDLTVVDGAVEGYRVLTWQEFAAANIPIIQGFLSRFEAIVDVGPAQDRDTLHSMVRHETSILRWVSMESENVPEGSLDDVIAQLQYPLPIPAGV